MSLFKKTVKLAHDNPHLRPKLLPLLKEARTRPRNIYYDIEIYLVDSPRNFDINAGMTESSLTLRELAKVRVEDEIGHDTPLRDMDWEMMEVVERGTLVRVTTDRWEQPISYDDDMYIGRYVMDIEREDGEVFSPAEIEILQGMLGIRRVRTR